MDYVMLAKMVSKLSSMLNETDDVGDCMYWGPCELCEWGVEKFDNFANETKLKWDRRIYTKLLALEYGCIYDEAEEDAQIEYEEFE